MRRGAQAVAVLLLAALLAALLPGAEAHAAPNAEKSVEVLRRDGDITILPNGDVHVVETWQVHFIGGPFTYAFRKIPFEKVEDIVGWQIAEGDRRYQEAESAQVYAFQVERTSDAVEVTWYFPQTTDATRTFTLAYTLKGALWIGEQNDAFHWIFIENDHGYPIGESSVKVHLPQAFDPAEIATLAGHSEDEKSGAGQVVSGDTVVFSQSEIKPYEDWVIGVKWPHGAVNAEPPAWEREALRRVEMPSRTGVFTILPNGDIHVTETWQAKFIEGPFYEASRTYDAKFVDRMTHFQVAEGSLTYTRVDDVFDLGPHTFVAKRYGDTYFLYWEFPKTYNDSRTFTISYTLKGAVRQGKAVDEFAWIFATPSHDYPIRHAEVVFHLPAAFDPDAIQADSFLGSVEGEPTGHGKVIDGQTVRFTAEDLAPNQPWGVRVRWPHGAIDAPLPAWQRIERIKPWATLGLIVGAFLLAILGIGSAYLLWYLRGGDPAAGVAPTFLSEPPDKLPPAVVGVLLKERVDQRDITTATLLDLARRGYIQILTTPDDTILMLRKTIKGDRSLRPYERRFLEAIFGRGGKEEAASLSALRGKFFSHLDEIREALYKEVVRLKFFPAPPDRVRHRYYVLAWGVLALMGLFSCAFLAIAPDWLPSGGVVLVLLSALATVMAYFIVAPHMPRKTKKGAIEAAKWEAFKRYLESLRKYSVWKREGEQVREKLADYLPYAIVFGLKHSFSHWFKQAADIPAPAWYRTIVAAPSSAGGTSRGVQGGRGKGLAAAAATGKTSSPSLGQALDDAAAGTFHSLSQIADSLFDSLESASATFTTAPKTSSGSSSSGWSGGGSSSFSGGGSFGGFSGGGGGGGSSGFG